jgi:hypothetical protein
MLENQTTPALQRLFQEAYFKPCLMPQVAA